MSDYEADELMEQMEKWDAKHARQDFLARMERKMHHKERFSR